MANQFEALGFRADEDFPALLERTPGAQRLVDMEQGLYLCWAPGSGIEAWLSLARETGEVLDWEVHLVTDTRCGCAFDRDVMTDPAGQSGLVRLLLRPEEGDIPVVASVPVLAGWAEREAGAPGLAQLCCHASDMAPAGDAPDALMGEEGDSRITLTGTVTACETLRNPCTGRLFRRLTVESCGVSLDVTCAGGADEWAYAGGRVRVSGPLTAAVEPGVCAPGKN